MRVLHLTPFYGPAQRWGGPARATALLCAGLAQRGITVEVATTEPETPVAAGVTVLKHNSVGKGRFFLAPKMARELRARAAEFDVVHAHGFWMFPVLVGALIAADRPMVLSLHGSLQSWALQQKWLKKKIYLATLGRFTLGRAGVMHFTSERERDDTPAKLRDAESVIIPNAVELEPLLALEPPAAEPEVLHVLMLGRVHPVKGFDVILPALARARRTRPINLTIAGFDEGGHAAEVRGAADRLGLGDAVSFTGPLDRDGVVAALNAADLVAMPSHQESFGLAAAEGIAAGRAVMVSNRVGIAPDVEAAGGGWVLPLHTPAWTAALLEAAQRVPSPNRAYASTKWAPEVVATRMHELYERLVRA